MFSWYRQVTPRERKTFWACFGGWSLDALEVQMFGLAIPALIAAFALSKGDAGLISGVREGARGYRATGHAGRAPKSTALRGRACRACS